MTTAPQNECVRKVLINALATSDPEKVKDQIEHALCILDDENYQDFLAFRQQMRQRTKNQYESI